MDRTSPSIKKNENLILLHCW